MRADSGFKADERMVRRGASACKFDVVAIGASAGGLHALSRVLSPLPQDFGCAILVVQHLSPDHRSLLAELPERATNLAVHQAVDGEPTLPGVVYIAAPNLYLLAEAGAVRLLPTPAVHHSRPSIDLLFDSVALNYGARAIALVLSGSGHDGAAGIRAVKGGGTTMAEDPATSEFSSMPYAAVATGCVDLVVPLTRLANTLVQLCDEAP